MRRTLLERRFGWQVVCLTTVALTMGQAAWAAKSKTLRAPKPYPTPTLAEGFDSPDPANPLELRAAAEVNDGVEVVRERHANGKVKIERQVTLDQEGNYVNHGTWKMYTQNGDVVSEGQYDMGKRVGTWTRWLDRNNAPVLGQYPFNRFKAPFLSQASFTDDVLDGEWLILDSQQRKCVQLSLNMGQRNGPVIMWLPDGKTYRQAAYVDGVPTGDFFDIDKNGELKLSATFIEGRKIDTKTTYYKSGQQKKTEEMFLAAKTVVTTPDDYWTLRFADYGSEGQDLRHGPSRGWFENGSQEHEGIYQRDKKDGSFTYWYANGQVAAAGEFQDDVPIGLWVWWHETGQKAAIGKYRSGSLIGQWRWWGEDGRLAKQESFDGSEAVAVEIHEVLRLGQAPSRETTTR